MIILIGMWLCIFYCIIEYCLKTSNTITIIFYSFIIFSFFTIIGSDVGHIGLGMVIGLITAGVGVAFTFEGKRRANIDNINVIIKEIKEQNKYDDDYEIKK